MNRIAASHPDGARAPNSAPELDTGGLGLAAQEADWAVSDVLPLCYLNGWDEGSPQLGALGGHALRVAAYAFIAARSYGLHERVCQRLRQVAAFHDIGKTLLPPALLKKPGALSPQERHAVESHTTLGYEMLLASDVPTLREAAVVAFCHHERMDGLGYPRRRLAAEIPLAARIVSVADVFDALTSTRTYRPALSQNQAADTLRQGRGSQFDAEVVDAFLQALPSLPKLLERLRLLTEDRSEPTPTLLKNTREDALRLVTEASPDWQLTSWEPLGWVSDW